MNATVSDLTKPVTLTKRDEENSLPTIGILCLGAMGPSIATRLINCGYRVTTWSNNGQIGRPIPNSTQRATPAEVTSEAKVIMAFLKDGPVSKHVLMSHQGAINSLDSNKSYLDFTTMDPGTADDMAAAIRFRNSRFMNISVIGDVRQASNGALTLLMSGDRTIKVEHEPMLACISNN